MPQHYMFLLVGLIPLAAIPVVIYLWYRNKTFLEQSLQARGEVVGLDPKPMQKGGTGYAPIVRFQTSDGRSIEFTGSTYSRPAAYEIGQRVDLLYHRERNEEARVTTPGHLPDPMGIFYSGLGATLIVGLCLLMFAMSIVGFFIFEAKAERGLP